MSLLQTANIDMEINRLKKELDESGLRKELKLKAIPKPSERKKKKALMASVRRRKLERKKNGSAEFGCKEKELSRMAFWQKWREDS